jgi:membrane associated rhomboid family serine protease
LFVPIYDGQPIRHIGHPYVRDGIIAVNVVVFLLMQAGLLLGSEGAAEASLGFIPIVFFGDAVLPAELDVVPSTLTLLTSLFVHAGWLHLGGNMLFLVVFGDNVEDDIGHVGFLAFYLACGAIATIVYGFSLPNSETPLVGASGAVAGVVAGYVILHPYVKLWVLVLARIPLRISARWMIGAWIIFQFVSAFLAADDAVAWWAHIGGFAAGALLIGLFKRRDVLFFDRGAPPLPPAQ